MSISDCDRLRPATPGARCIEEVMRRAAGAVPGSGHRPLMTLLAGALLLQFFSSRRSPGFVAASTSRGQPPSWFLATCVRSGPRA